MRTAMPNSQCNILLCNQAYAVMAGSPLLDDLGLGAQISTTTLSVCHAKQLNFGQHSVYSGITSLLNEMTWDYPVTQYVSINTKSAAKHQIKQQPKHPIRSTDETISTREEQCLRSNSASWRVAGQARGCSRRRPPGASRGRSPPQSLQQQQHHRQTHQTPNANRGDSWGRSE